VLHLRIVSVAQACRARSRFRRVVTACCAAPLQVLIVPILPTWQILAWSVMLSGEADRVVADALNALGADNSWGRNESNPGTLTDGELGKLSVHVRAENRS
jgi:hypothetical protein